MSRLVLQDGPEGTLLAVHVQPKAARSKIVGLHGGALKVRVAAPPAEGAANEELCRHLALCLDLPKSRVVVEAGHHQRRKLVRIKDLRAARVREILGLPDGG